MEHVAGQEPRHGRRLQVQLPLLGVRASYSENGTGETLALTPALSPQERGNHAHFPEFSPLWGGLASWGPTPPATVQGFNARNFLWPLTSPRTGPCLTILAG